MLFPMTTLKSFLLKIIDWRMAKSSMDVLKYNYAWWLNNGVDRFTWKHKYLAVSATWVLIKNITSHWKMLIVMIIRLYQSCGWTLVTRTITLVIYWQILGQQPVGEFAKRHVYEQYQSKNAVSEKWRLFFLILIIQAMLRDDEGKLQG